MASVKSECPACDGTGLYRGMAEGPGVAVVCSRCDGGGCVNVEYTPFTSRKRRSDVREVFLSRGNFVLACGPTGNPVSYEDFMAGKRPTPARKAT